MRFLAAALCVSVFLSGPASATAPKPLRPEIAAFIGEMAQKHQYDRALLQRVLGTIKPRASILRAMSAPGTARPWHVFRGRYIDDVRISAGARFWRQHADVVGRASREFGVPEEIIVATIGVETVYGRDTGSFNVLEALTTLAFDYPPRAEFFRGELEQFLLLARELGLDITRVRGSYAGAIGIPQFLPSSYRKYAVDYDGDGRADLSGAPGDAIGSVANYYRAFGWETGGTVAVRAEAADSVVDTVLAAGIRPHTRVGELRQRGIVPLAPVRDDAEAALFSLETESGIQHWLGLQNFYVITRYNRSVNYAMVVYELALELRSAMQREGRALQPQPRAP
jgi:membrane-bound lytic murein transglycosylase B